MATGKTKEKVGTPYSKRDKESGKPLDTGTRGGGGNREKDIDEASILQDGQRGGYVSGC
jgi:hypothetical protein